MRLQSTAQQCGQQFFERNRVYKKIKVVFKKKLIYFTTYILQQTYTLQF